MNKRIQKKVQKRERARAASLAVAFTKLGEVFTKGILNTMEAPGLTAQLFATDQEWLNEFNRTHDWVRDRR